ncbi:MAG TPA: CHAP domain-containing protein [Vitreimonas sp.]|uniref:CHAP domain-containing protein n=1 Tax=Vitreimonas sp. TaxID=3069702 RepID=UPI002D4853C6|nr:CHAP domain-containing protein [Vitreimonas sp.]HYD86586.1 CHAP domain-containing protein [Vitreimonas sp.]
MLDSRALLLAAAAVAGFAAPSDASALTPLSMDLAIDPSVTDGASDHSRLAPSAFERLPDEVYEPTARVTNGRARLQCVPFARRESGVDLYGNANTWWRQAAGRYETAEDPSEGAVLVLHGYATSSRGHVAVVKEIVSSRMIIVDHANWLNAGEITRDVPIQDVSEAGDWSEVRVWHVPGRHWGGRTYRVQGFILNVLAEAARQQTAASAAGVPVG